MLSAQQDIADCSEEVAAVGEEGVLLVGEDVASLGGLNVFDGLGRHFVVVERGEQAGLDAEVKGLHLGGVEAEVVIAQRTYADELHIAANDVDEHGQFVEPILAQELSQTTHAIVGGEFATFLQAFVLVDVGLKVLGVGMHGAELVDADFFAVQAFATQTNEEAGGGMVVAYGLALLAGNDVELAVADFFAQDFEAGAIEFAQHLDAREGALVSLGDPHIEIAHEEQFGADAAP